jgi:hypothetical protein
MNSRKSLALVLAVSLVVLVLPAAVMAASVSAECAYTDTDVVCEVYVDTASVELRSGGVRLTYTPGDLTVNSAEINDAAWFFGAGGSDYATPNAIDTSVPGIVDLVVGKLDTNAISAGVIGTKVLIGRVTFDRNNNNLPAIAAGLARGGEPFVSFVNATSGAPLDGTTFNTIVAERGDANQDGAITNVDMGLTRNIILNSGYSIFADVNGDGMVTNVDMGLVRNKILGL